MDIPGYLRILLPVAVLATVVYVVWRPREIYPVLVVSMPIVSTLYFIKYGLFSAVDVFYGAVFIAAIISIVFNAKSHFKGWEILGWYVLVFAVYIGSAMYNGVDILPALDPIIKMGYGVLAYIVVRNHYTSEDSRKIVKSMYISVVIFLTMGVAAVLQGGGERYSEFSYSVGYYADEGSLSRAAVLGVLLSLPIPGLTFDVIRLQIVRYALLGVSLLFLGYAVSRNAVLAAAAVLLFYSYSSKRYLVGILIVAVALVLYFQSDIIQENYENKLRRETQFLGGDGEVFDYLGSGRMGRWRSVYDIFMNSEMDRVILGYGVGYGPHGQHMELWLRAGLIGFFVVIFQYVKMTRTYVRHKMRRGSGGVNYYYGAMLLTTWLLFLTATPFYEMYIQMILFALYGIIVNDATENQAEETITSAGGA